MNKKENKEQIENTTDLTFCFEANIILEEALNKLNYIGTYTTSNSKSAMSKSIGIQIDNKLKRQSELEKYFDELIKEKSKKVELVEEKEINDLTRKIQQCAEELKLSTNNICKSLAENPDIPSNLIKAKEDQKIIASKLNEIKDDLLLGQMKKFDEIMEQIERNSINIEEKRKIEMSYMKELKKLNEDIAKEEADYNKDQKDMNKRIVMMKKELAQTKLQENMFAQYRKNQISSLENLITTNFEESKKKVLQDIDDKVKEKVSIKSLLAYRTK